MTDRKPIGVTVPYRLDKSGKVAVDHDYFWQPIATCPRGAKVQLLGAGGVAMYGSYSGKEKFYTHWAPLPKLKKEST
jgi:hypothetical protein